MYPANYVTYAQVEDYARKHYERYGTKTSFKTIVKYLFEHQQLSDRHACPAVAASLE